MGIGIHPSPDVIIDSLRQTRGVTDTPLSTPAPPRRGTARIAVLVAAGTVVAVLAGAAGAYLLLRQDEQPASTTATVSSTPSAPAAAEPTTFKVTGEVILPNGYSGTTTCRGSGPYQDIKVGAKVTVRDADGGPVGSGALDVGEVKQPKGCVFPFSVPNVPTGGEPYTIEVTHRLGPQYSEAVISTQNIELALGQQSAS